MRLISSSVIARLVIGLITTCSSFAAIAGEDLALRDRAFDFLEKNVIGKKMDNSLELVNKQAGFASKFSKQAKFIELVKTDRGMKFKLVAVIQQVKTNLVNDQPDPATAKTIDRVVVADISVAQRRSTGALSGRMVLTTNTLSDPGADVDIVTIQMDDNSLTMTTESAPYTDGFGPGDKYIPVISKEVTKYTVNDAGNAHSRADSTVTYLDESLQPKGEPIKRTIEIDLQ